MTRIKMHCTYYENVITKPITVDLIYANTKQKNNVCHIPDREAWTHPFVTGGVTLESQVL